jgi:hypothetical protein
VNQELVAGFQLDVMPTDRTRDEEVKRLLALGATEYEDHRNADGTGWVTMADPEGNLFCVERSATERYKRRNSHDQFPAAALRMRDESLPEYERLLHLASVYCAARLTGSVSPGTICATEGKPDEPRTDFTRLSGSVP